MSIRKPEPKTAVKMLRAAFAESVLTKDGFSVKQAYDLLAHLEGYKNWAHAKPFLENGSSAVSVQALPMFGMSQAEIQGWPVYVIFMDYREADGEEVLRVLPLGATLANRTDHRNGWMGLDEAGAIEMPDIFEGITDENALDAKRLASLVVKEVFSMVPRVDRYGLPMFANDYAVQDWAVDEMGWNYLAVDSRAPKGNRRASGVEVQFRDTGDDSGERYWAEVAVAPEVAVVFEAEFKDAAVKEKLGLTEEWAGHCLDNAYKGSDPKTRDMLKLNRIFAECDGKTLGEIFEVLVLASAGDKLSEPCEEFLRRKLSTDLLTINGPFDNWSVGELLVCFEQAMR